jgi:HD-GYP domain-containing protein (c-di-GMP phosphodiesterase class II)
MMPIGVGTLRASAMFQFDLYRQADNTGQPALYCRRQHPFSQDDLDRLVARGVRTLYIASTDSQAYRDYLRDNILKNESIPPEQRYQALREGAREVLSKALSGGDPTSAVQVASDLSEDLVATVCDSQLMVNELLKSMMHDYSGFAHAMNVSTYSLLLARRLGISDDQELLRIAQGALLHDIGMQFVPRRILDKPRKLTDKERQVVQQHTTRGFVELSRRDDLTAGQLMMVYGHHERCDGRGYPAGLVRSEIHEYARLCAVVDVYAALTSDRPHRPASRHANVIEYLDRQAGRAFDEEMTRCWIATIQNRL